MRFFNTPPHQLLSFSLCLFTMHAKLPFELFKLCIITSFSEYICLQLVFGLDMHTPSWFLHLGLSLVQNDQVPQYIWSLHGTSNSQLSVWLTKYHNILVLGNHSVEEDRSLISCINHVYSWAFVASTWYSYLVLDSDIVGCLLLH